MKDIYQFKVQLQGIRPAIYRNILVEGDITFHELHHTIQIVMGWFNSHLYQFNAGTRSIADPAFVDFGEVEDAKELKLNQVFAQKGDTVEYEYDFGDGWIHTVRLDKILPPKANEDYPKCVGGKRKCPPEDCGGVWGYENLLEVMADKTHPEYKDMKAWLGGNFDPEAFALEDINEELEKLEDYMDEKFNRF
jgi:pRiA4b ORF-3-like protein